MVRITPTSRTCLDALVLLFSVALIYSWIILGGKDVGQRVMDKENITRDTETAFDSFYLKSNLLLIWTNDFAVSRKCCFSPGLVTQFRCKIQLFWSHFRLFRSSFESWRWEIQQFYLKNSLRSSKLHSKLRKSTKNAWYV